MIDLETDVTRRHGVTFVTATVTNTRSTPQAIRLEPRLEGPVWTPRLGSPVAAEWADGTWAGVVGPGQRRGVGFATPTELDDHPLELASATRASSEERSAPTETLATLEDWAPIGAVLLDAPTAAVSAGESNLVFSRESNE